MSFSAILGTAVTRSPPPEFIYNLRSETFQRQLCHEQYFCFYLQANPSRESLTFYGGLRSLLIGGEPDSAYRGALIKTK
jgi:hypothetical protein